MSSQPSTQRAGSDMALRLARIEQSLQKSPADADRLAGELLADFPGHPMASLFQGIARRLLGNAAGAIEVLDPLCKGWPDAPLPHLQLGLALRETGKNEQAETAMRRAVAIKPDFSDAWLSLADLLRAMDQPGAADAAYVGYVRCSALDPDIAAAVSALRENRAADAEVVLRARLQQHPTDVAAMCLLADAFARSGFPAEAEILLKDCLALAPGYRAARLNYAVLLNWQNRPEEALRHCEQLLESDPDDGGVLVVKANVLRNVGDYEACVSIYRRVLDGDPAQPRVWTSLGHTLRTLGRTEECIDAFRRAIAADPHRGEAYWGLASLQPSPLTDADVQAMNLQVGGGDLRPEDVIHFQFALGRAYETRRAYAESFGHYAEGNRRCHDMVHYDPAEMTGLVRRSKALFTREFFSTRTGGGSPAPDPIFIVGLPRAGSTLVEQILSSHPAVEGTAELPDLPALARKLDARVDGKAPGRYPEVLAELDAAALRQLGEDYLLQARRRRKSDRPYFIDKMPNNFAHTGLIQLILPNARIVDVRRHPLACGLSLFKLLFAHGQHFAYSLDDIGRYYLDYAELMAHYDAALPGRVHLVHYERLVRDTEAEVRRLLEYCGLPFEPACLRYYETRRPVSTPSAEQVRTPIFQEGIEHWRHFEPWLGPLKDALGEVWTSYPTQRI